MLSARWPKAVATLAVVLTLSGVAWAAGSQLGVIGPSNGCLLYTSPSPRDS